MLDRIVLEEVRECPQCKSRRPLSAFEGLPVDARCNSCVTTGEAMQIYDQRVQMAGQKLSRILDANQAGKQLKPLERMISQCYDAWGGPAAFCEDVVGWIKDLADQGRGKGAAVNAATKLLALHAKVDRMKLEDDWKQMDDATIRDTLKLRLMELMAEAAEESGKKDALSYLLGQEDGPG